MAERATGIAFGIEFFVGRRERDRAISDTRAASELINQGAIRSFRKGAQERQQAHETAVQALRGTSKKAMEDLAKARTTAAKQAVSTYESMKPPTPEEYAEGRDLGVGELEEYRAGFERTIRAMDGSLAQFAARASDVGLSFKGTDVDSVMEGFAEGDATERKAAMDDLNSEVKRRETLIKTEERKKGILQKQV